MLPDTEARAAMDLMSSDDGGEESDFRSAFWIKRIEVKQSLTFMKPQGARLFLNNSPRALRGPVTKYWASGTFPSLP